MLELSRLITLYADAKELPPTVTQGVGNTIEDFFQFINSLGYYLTEGPGRN